MHYVFESPYALWPFGSGLSYTAFSYDNPSVTRSGDEIIASVTVTNTGDRDGKEVVQLYVSDAISTVLTPVRQLKAFEKIALAPGESRTVSMRVPFDELRLYNGDGEWVVEPGEFVFSIGRSSADLIHSESITL